MLDTTAEEYRFLLNRLTDYFNNKNSMNRREFIKNVARAGVAVGFPTIIPASALGKDGAVAPSERITMASIGLGTQGTANTKTSLAISACK